MDATCKVQDSIHAFRLVNNMCPGFWVHIITRGFLYTKKPTTKIPLQVFGGEGGIRTHGTRRYTAFRVQLVMTASILLHIRQLRCTLCECKEAVFYDIIIFEDGQGHSPIHIDFHILKVTSRYSQPSTFRFRTPVP